MILAALAWQAAYFTLPYVSLAPGSAGSITSLLKVPADRSHPPRGEFLITTVSLKQTTVYDAIQGWLDPDIDVLPEEALFGNVDPDQYSQIAREDMNTSKQSAVVVALRRLGYTIPERGKGALIRTLAGPEVPVAGVLQAGDTVVAIDGKPTTLAQDAVAVLQTRKAGDSLGLSVVSAAGGEPRIETVTLGSRTADSCVRGVVAGATGCLGVELGTRGQEFDLPFEVSIDTQGIGGPSAGLAFALALLDQLTPGELTGGKKVAVTGTIDIDGMVGDVGGVRQKTAAVRASGADVFLVPPGEFAFAKARAGKKLQVIAVRNLDEALAALGSIGGDLAALDNSGETT